MTFIESNTINFLPQAENFQIFRMQKNLNEYLRIFHRARKYESCREWKLNRNFFLVLTVFQKCSN